MDWQIGDMAIWISRGWLVQIDSTVQKLSCQEHHYYPCPFHKVKTFMGNEGLGVYAHVNDLKPIEGDDIEVKEEFKLGQPLEKMP